MFAHSGRHVKDERHNNERILTGEVVAGMARRRLKSCG
jgi:hypothetical protein